MIDEPWHDDATAYDREAMRRALDALPAEIQQARANLLRSAEQFARAAGALAAATKRATDAMRTMFAAIPPEQLREMRRLARWAR